MQRTVEKEVRLNGSYGSAQNTITSWPVAGRRCENSKLRRDQHTAGQETGAVPEKTTHKRGKSHNKTYQKKQTLKSQRRASSKTRQKESTPQPPRNPKLQAESQCPTRKVEGEIHRRKEIREQRRKKNSIPRPRDNTERCTAPDVEAGQPKFRERTPRHNDKNTTTQTSPGQLKPTIKNKHKKIKTEKNQETGGPEKTDHYQQ